MANASYDRKSVQDGGFNAHFLSAMRAGYEDNRLGRPWRDVSGDQVVQSNYEAGRFYAQNVRAAGLRLFAWRTPDLPPKVNDQIRRSIRAQGRPEPGPMQRKDMTEAAPETWTLGRGRGRRHTVREVPTFT